MGISVSSDKFCSIEQATSLVKDGDKVVVGGVLTAREPNALVRQIIRDGRKQLHAIAGAHTFAIDLMCAAGVVGTCETSFVGYEFDLGLALNYRRACEKGKVTIKETDCNILLQQFRAAQYGVPFMPMPKLGGSGLLKIHPEFKEFSCPVTGERLMALPALVPDVALLHAHYGDIKGNVKIMGPVFKDKLFAIIAKTVLVTVEEIVPEEKMQEMQPTIPYYHVNAIVEAPFGAHPSACYPNYAYDRKHLQEFVVLSKKEEMVKDYLDTYVYGPATYEKYYKAIGGIEKSNRLGAWGQSREQWMEVFS